MQLISRTLWAFNSRLRNISLLMIYSDRLDITVATKSIYKYSS